MAWPLIGIPYWADRLARAADDVRDAAPAEALRGYEAAVQIGPGRDALWVKLVVTDADFKGPVVEPVGRLVAQTSITVSR